MLLFNRGGIIRFYFNLKGRYQLFLSINFTLTAAALGTPSFNSLAYTLSAIKLGSFLLKATRNKSGQRVPSNPFSNPVSLIKFASI